MIFILIKVLYFNHKLVSESVVIRLLWKVIEVQVTLEINVGPAVFYWKLGHTDGKFIDQKFYTASDRGFFS